MQEAHTYTHTHTHTFQVSNEQFQEITCVQVQFEENNDLRGR